MNAETVLQCSCPHCTQDLEYAEAMMGQEIPCPTCSGPLILTVYETAPVEPRRRGLFASIVGKYKDRQARIANERAFRDELFMAVADGVLTEDEVHSIVERQTELGLDEEFLRKHSRDLLSAAIKSVMRDGCCAPEKYRNIELMANHLGVSLGAYSELFQTLTRAMQKYNLRHAPLVPLLHINVMLQKGEVAYWLEPGQMYEEKVVRRRYEGGSAGVSFRVAKGVSFRVGNHRGNLVSETAHVAVSAGSFVVTNQRLLFIGDRKSFSASHRKILQLQPANDGIHFTETNKQKPRIVIYDHPNGDLVFEVLQRVVTAD